MTSNIRILIADDHPMVESALKQAIVGAAGEDFDVLGGGIARFRARVPDAPGQST